MSVKSQIINKVIDSIEGGYYHPDMKSKLRNGERMANSGETMFGLDRRNGAPGVTTDTPSGVKFWQIIDKYYGTHHGDTAYYGDKADGKKADIPASVGKQLKRLAADVILHLYEQNKKFLSADVQKVVEKSPQLLLQFLYATWNGSGNFQNFANACNTAYKNGTTTADGLYNVVQKARRAKGGLFAEGADKLDKIAAQLRGGSLWWILAAIGGGILCYNLFKN